MRRAGLCFLLLLVGCVTTATDCRGVASADGAICALNRDPAVTVAQIRTLAEQAARERGALAAYLGHDVGTITLIVRDRGNAYHKPPATIVIPTRQISKRHAITAHEITHLLTQGWASQILKEGLAVYVQERFGEQQGWPNYRRSAHAVARRWMRDGTTGIQTLAEAEATLQRPPSGNRKQRLAAYSLAGSFVRWLIETKFDGGVDRFLAKLYRSGDYQSALNRSNDALRGEWRRDLLAG